MIFTLFGFIISLIVYFVEAPGLHLLSIFAPAGGVLLLGIWSSFAYQILKGCRQVETESYPGVLSALRSCQATYWTDRALFAIALYSLVTILFDNSWMQLAWIVLFSAGLDLLLWKQKQMSVLFDPYWLANHAPGDLVERIDSLTSCAAMAIGSGNVSLAQGAIEATHREIAEKLEAEPKEKQGYVVSYWIKRLNYINELSKQQLITPIDLLILKILGKSTVRLAAIDSALASTCLQELGRAAKEAQEWSQHELVDQTGFVAVQTARMLLQNVRESDLTAPLVDIVGLLEEIATETFRRNKDSNLLLLTQPLQDLRVIFEEADNSSRSDVVTAGATLNRVLSDFTALEEVVAKMRAEQQEQE